MRQGVDIGLIGCGEVGAILIDDLHAAGARVTAYDLRFEDPADSLAGSVRAAGATAAASLPEAVRGRDLVISAVTAAAAEAVSLQAAKHLAAGAFLVDLNSVSPATRRISAEATDAGGGRYVEAAVMAPFPPRRIATPTLLGGPHAAAARPLLSDLGFKAQVFAATIGRASAVKMCRSIFVKGLEAIVSESLLAARRYGVETEVLASLSNTLPHDDWPRLAKYLVTRTLIHGRRRSEEMREVVQTLRDAGLSAWMSEGAVLRQSLAADLAIDDPEAPTLDRLLDLMLARAEMEGGRAEDANA